MDDNTPDELLTYGERIHRQREGLLQELEAFGLGQGEHVINTTDEARELLGVAQSLEVIDRIIYRRERVEATLLPTTQVVNAPTEGELRVAIWQAMEELGATTKAADQLTGDVLRRLGYGQLEQDEPVQAPHPDEADPNNDSGAQG